MTGKLRLEDLRVHYTKHISDAFGDRSLTAARPATIADWVEVGRQLGAEIVMPIQNNGVHVAPGRYLIYKLPVESPTPKEEQL